MANADAELDALLSDLAATPVAPPDADFMARLIEDARAELPVGFGAVEARLGWRGLVAAIGGWPAVSGLAAAGLAGIWIGVAPPQVVDDMIAGLTGGAVSLELTGLEAEFGLEI